MGFMNAFLRTVRCSSFHIVMKDGVKGQFPMRISQHLVPCRMLTVTHCMKTQEKPSASEKIDLDTWKNILRNAAPKAESEPSAQETEEESTLESMQKLVDMWRLAGKAVPDSISTEELQALLQLPTKSSRKKYLKLLLIKEQHKKNRQKKRLEKEQSKSNDEINPEKQSSYLKVWKRTEDGFDSWRCVQAMIFGQPLVFDMAYDRYMSQRELENTVSQLQMCEGYNKKSMEPFHIHFCNLQPNGPYHKELVKRYQGSWDNVLITATEKSHVDVFPKDRLVYLTADSPNVLKTFDHDKIYIIGAFVDKSQKTGVSLGNAKRLQLATARLPLDNFLKWNCGGKNLTLNHVIEILMTIRDTGDWNKSLSSVPIRKHHGFWDGRESSEFTDKHKKTQTNSTQQRHKNWWQERD